MNLLHQLLFENSPSFVEENFQLLLFLALLTYVLFLIHWILSTDWESKFHWFSLIIASFGTLYLHYSNALLVLEYELLFVACWVTLLFYHGSSWNTNFTKIHRELNSTTVVASLRPYQGSILRYLITLPRHKNSSNQWEAPPFRNAIHVALILLYSLLLSLHIFPFISPVTYCYQGGGDDGISALCCRYNYAIEGFDTQSVSTNFCSGHVRIAFAGSWSTGKTTIINALLGHNYSTSQMAPAPSTDKFVCLSLGAPYSGPVQSDDYESRQHCEMMGHIQDVVTHKVCRQSLPNVVDVADTNQEFDGFVFVDMPGWQTEYGNDCAYKTFYEQLIEKVDFVYVVWDVHHGKIEDEFAAFFHEKARGTNYEMIYNQYDDRHGADMAFLNQQYAKMSHGQELLSEPYITKIHNYNTASDPQVFRNDIDLLRAKIQSVNQTVHDNRKKLMKKNLLEYRSKITGLLSLRKIKLGDQLIQDDLNVHVPPKSSWLRKFGIEL